MLESALRTRFGLPRGASWCISLLPLVIALVAFRSYVERTKGRGGRGGRDQPPSVTPRPGQRRRTLSRMFRLPDTVRIVPRRGR